MKHKFLLTGLMLLLGLTISAQESGTCDENITWTLEDGTLTISGTGEMANYGSYTSVPWYSFHSSITSVTIADGVTSIGGFAFYGCSNLTSVTIPNSVISIGMGAFYECSSLTSVTLPNSVTSIDYMAFAFCCSLTTITIPENVVSIANYAFYVVSNVRYTGTATGSPWGARSVNGYVDGCLIYSDASKTTLLACSAAAKGEIVIPNSVTSIGETAFYNCRSLTSVTIPNSVTNIGGYAFYGCSSLASVTISNSVTSIENGAFMSCSSLTSVTIPNSVTNIGGWAFSGCSSLISIILDEANSDYCDIDGVLFSKDKTTLVQFPAGKGTSYTIPNSVTNIGFSAFSNCQSLTSVTIPNSVTNIEEDAFNGCSSMTSITCEAVNPPVCGNDVFYNVDKSIPLYVPANSMEAYKEADGWKDFQDNIQPITAQEAETEFETAEDEVRTDSSDDKVVIEWPASNGADTYIITVSCNEVVICVLTFDADGRLLDISINIPHIAARDRRNAEAAVQTIKGWQYTIKGLNAGTTYDYTVIAKKQGVEEPLYSKGGTFKTTGTATGIEETDGENGKNGYSGRDGSAVKVMRDGVTYIVMPDGRMYDLQGKEVR